MLPNGRSIGVHLPLGNGMVWAAERAQEVGASALQVFADNPTSWRRRANPPTELPAFRARVGELGLDPLVIHAAYLVNLAGPDPDFFARSVGVLAAELRAGVDYGARFVNAHTGSHRGEGFEAGAARIAAGAREALRALDGVRDGPILLFENSAGAGFGIGATLDELGLIADALLAEGLGQVGFCLDTAHLWGAGHAIDSAPGVDELLAAFDGRIGLERLRLVHLNDSRTVQGSRQDRHEHLGAGGVGAEGLRRFLTHPGLDHVAYILETPGTDDGYDAVNLQRAKDLVAGRPLDELPPEAFTIRATRGRSAPADEDEVSGHAVGGAAAGTTAGAMAQPGGAGRGQADRIPPAAAADGASRASSGSGTARPAASGR